MRKWDGLLAGSAMLFGLGLLITAAFGFTGNPDLPFWPRDQILRWAPALSLAGILGLVWGTLRR